MGFGVVAGQDHSLLGGSLFACSLLLVVMDQWHAEQSNRHCLESIVSSNTIPSSDEQV